MYTYMDVLSEINLIIIIIIITITRRALSDICTNGLFQEFGTRHIIKALLEVLPIICNNGR